MAKVGLDFFRMDTNRYQDIRIKRLKKEFSTSGIAVYDYILTEIYRVKGSFIEWDESTAFDVSEYFGIKESLVNEIVNYCCNVGLFDARLRAMGVLTSKSIQVRYTDMCKAAKRNSVEIPEKYLILPEEIPNVQEETPKIQEEIDIVNNSIVNNSIVNNSKEEKSIPPKVGFDFQKKLLDYGFEKELIHEWLLVRKKKKCVNTETAFKIFISEVEKTGLEKNELLKKIISKSWGGFESDWLIKLQPQKQNYNLSVNNF